MRGVTEKKYIEAQAKIRGECSVCSLFFVLFFLEILKTVSDKNFKYLILSFYTKELQRKLRLKTELDSKFVKRYERKFLKWLSATTSDYSCLILKHVSHFC